MSNVVLPLMDNLFIEDKKVLLRTDFNVPFFKVDHPLTQADISDDFRIRSTLPTINKIIEKRGIPIILAHMGRPNGKKDPRLSLAPVAVRLENLIGRKVIFLNDCMGEEVVRTCAEAKVGDIIFLENLRFYAEEEENNEDFAGKLAGLGDVFINEAFGDAHRAHASIVALPALLPHAAGLLMQHEIEALGRLRDNPMRPLVAIMGGAKISTKIAFLEKFLPWVDGLLLGGALSSTLLKAKGLGVGNSLIEASMVERLASFDYTSSKLHLPVDVMVANKASNDVEVYVRGETNVMQNESIFDIGPETQKLFARIIGEAKTVFWNGPMGLHEIPLFATGTESIARAVAGSQAFSVVGGGDTTVILQRLALDKKIDFISTGGGAMLEYLCGQTLPGIEALRK